MGLFQRERRERKKGKMTRWKTNKKDGMEYRRNEEKKLRHAVNADCIQTLYLTQSCCKSYWSQDK